MSKDTIFTKIIKGEIPSYKVYEDDTTLAFMDVHPIQPGMVLVIPKNPVEDFMELPDDDYHALWSTVKRVANKMREVYPTKKRIAAIVEGLDVPHAHVKVFPIDSAEEFRNIPDESQPIDFKALEEQSKILKI